MPTLKQLLLNSISGAVLVLLRQPLGTNSTVAFLCLPGECR